MSSVLIVLLSFFFFSIASANNVLKIENNEIYKKPYWHKLLHYRKNVIGSNYESDINSHSFFLSPEGRFNPEAELNENIKQFSIPLTKENVSNHAACRFPARFKWINKELNWQSKTNLALCENYYKWTLGGNIKSVSIIFATGYFENPASYFGHPLVKFNIDKDQYNLLDLSVSYGAMTPESENPVVYILKGLLGGYWGSFTNTQFFYHHHNYTETELRDLWEYQLNLSPNAVEQVVDHSWELLGQDISYLFLSDNCATRMAELLELVMPYELLPRPRPYSIPNTLFHSVGNIKDSDGNHLFKKVKFIPSRQNRMSEKYNNLDKKSQKIIKNIIENTQNLSSKEFLENSDAQKANLIETLLDYYAFRMAKDKEDPTLKEVKRVLILERFKLPPSQEAQVLAISDEKLPPPHLGQPDFAARVSYIYSEEHKSMYELEIRPALYDFLTADSGKPKNTSLEVFKTTIRFTDDLVELRNLDFFSVSALNTSKTDLPEDGGMAWNVRVGLWSQNLLCTECLVGGAKGGFGYASELNEKLTVYSLFNLQAQSEKDNYGMLATSPVVGALVEWNKSWKSHLIAGYEAFFDGQKNQSAFYSLENRLKFSNNWDFRFKYEEQIDKQYKISYSHYW